MYLRSALQPDLFSAGGDQFLADLQHLRDKLTRFASGLSRVRDFEVAAWSGRLDEPLDGARQDIDDEPEPDSQLVLVGVPKPWVVQAAEECLRGAQVLDVAGLVCWRHRSLEFRIRQTLVMTPLWISTNCRCSSSLRR